MNHHDDDITPDLTGQASSPGSQGSGQPAFEATERDLRYGLEEAVDGELPHEMVERMTRHANGCPECADELERLRRIKELVRRSCADTAPTSLRERITVQYRSVTVTHTTEDGTSVSVRRTEYRER